MYLKILYWGSKHQCHSGHTLISMVIYTVKILALFHRSLVIFPGEIAYFLYKQKKKNHIEFLVLCVLKILLLLEVSLLYSLQDSGYNKMLTRIFLVLLHKKMFKFGICVKRWYLVVVLEFLMLICPLFIIRSRIYSLWYSFIGRSHIVSIRTIHKCSTFIFIFLFSFPLTMAKQIRHDNASIILLYSMFILKTLFTPLFYL